MACLVRVPTENVKQKMQAGLHGTATETMNAILKKSGMTGFYTGYLTTVVREIPFSFIQFPIYEGLKVRSTKGVRYDLRRGYGSICEGRKLRSMKGVWFDLRKVHTLFVVADQLPTIKFAPGLVPAFLFFLRKRNGYISLHR